MSQRDDLDVVWMFAIHKEKREMTKRHASNDAANPHATNGFADRWIPCNQVRRSLDLGPEAIAQTNGFILVPANVVTIIFLGFGVRAYW